MRIRSEPELGLAGGAAAGSVETYKASLSGRNEVPAIVSPASGELRITVSPDHNAIEFELLYLERSGTPSAAHIHVGQSNVSGGVSAFLCGGPRPPCPPAPVTSAAPVEGTIVVSDITGPSAQGVEAGTTAGLEALLQAVRSGRAYANVHTAKHPGGEIRGQLLLPGGPASLCCYTLKPGCNGPCFEQGQPYCCVKRCPCPAVID